MKIDGIVKFLLLVIAIFLGVIALRPYVTPPVVQAQSSGGYPVYFAPTAVMLTTPNGGALGRVAIDLRNGNVWGFPGFTQDAVVGFDKTLPISHPVLLGKLALADMDK
jgi:hypothetical protein